MTKTLELMILQDATAGLNSSQPTLNYGASGTLYAGRVSNHTERGIIRFHLPEEIIGKIIKQTLVLNVGGQTYRSDGLISINIHQVKEPYDELWIEGTDDGASTSGGVSWNDYSYDNPWPTPGGEFEAEPISTKVFKEGVSSNGYNDFEIHKDDLAMSAGKAYSFILKSADEGGSQDKFIAFVAQHGFPHVFQSHLILTLEVDDDEAELFEAEGHSSSEVKCSWRNDHLNESTFVKYQLQKSVTGTGSWVDVANITDFDTLENISGGYVVQGDVDDYDEDSDTYPNGRTYYFKLIIHFINDEGNLEHFATGVTIPTVRPMKMDSLTPYAKFWDEDFVDDNKALNPYGERIIPAWYDDNDPTETQYIEHIKIKYEVMEQAGWSTTFNETFTIWDFINGLIMEGKDGYTVYRIKAEVEDTGGLIRQFTLNKTTAQQEAALPAPAPVALPNGRLANPPPDMFGAFNTGDIAVDLSVAGQQSGERIFTEDYLNNVTDKWEVLKTGGAQTPVYSSGLMDLEHNGGVGEITIAKLFKQDLANHYNAFFEKYTGGYKSRVIFRFDTNWNFPNLPTNPVVLVGVSHCAWDKDAAANLGGYYIRLSDSQNNWDKVFLYYAKNIGAGGGGLLTWWTVGAGDRPLDSANKGKYILVDMITSPIFDETGAVEGSVVMIVYNIAATLSAVKNINLLTHPYIFVYEHTGLASDEQTHYTGRWMLNRESTTTQTNAHFEIHEMFLEGRVLGQQYGIKNINSGLVSPLSVSNKPIVNIACAPDLASETIYVEGRIKNEYGAQSRTNETDDYQGDLFNNLNPIAFLSVPKTGYTDQSVLMDGSQSIDPEGGSLIYKFDFGDSSTLETTDSSVRHTYYATGVYTVKLIVEDEAGLESAEVETLITIIDPIEQFQEITLMSPWISIDQGSPTGTGKTELPEVDYDIIQPMEGGNRVFNLTGVHNDPDDDHDLVTQMELATSEKDFIHFLKNIGQLITLDLEFYGKVKGVITDHRPAMRVDDQQAYSFSLTFQEVDNRQFEE